MRPPPVGVELPRGAFDEEYTRLRSDGMQLPLRLFVLRQSVMDVLRRLPRAREPGGHFRYTSSDAQVLGPLLVRATGQGVAELLEEAIWRPAGMEADAAWGTDLHGQELTYAFLTATLRDDARVGQPGLGPDTAPQLPRLNEPAPDFAAKTTHGMRRLADYQGKWLVLFSHPADFTPVCTTEVIGFARAAAPSPGGGPMHGP